MAFKEVLSLDADVTITLGGVDKKTKKKNPTQVEGYYLGKKALPPGKYTRPGRTDYLYIFQTAKGNVGVWGKTDLDRKIATALPGSMTRVTYAGMKPSPKGDMHTYKVEVDDENTIDVSNFAPQAAATTEDETEEGGYTSDEGSDDEPTDEETDDEAEEVEDTPPPRAVSNQVIADRAAKVAALLGKNKAKN